MPARGTPASAAAWCGARSATCPRGCRRRDGRRGPPACRARAGSRPRRRARAEWLRAVPGPRPPAPPPAPPARPPARCPAAAADRHRRAAPRFAASAAAYCARTPGRARRGRGPGAHRRLLAGSPPPAAASHRHPPSLCVLVAVGAPGPAAAFLQPADLIDPRTAGVERAGRTRQRASARAHRRTRPDVEHPSRAQRRIAHPIRACSRESVR